MAKRSDVILPMRMSLTYRIKAVRQAVLFFQKGVGRSLLCSTVQVKVAEKLSNPNQIFGGHSHGHKGFLSVDL